MSDRISKKDNRTILVQHDISQAFGVAAFVLGVVSLFVLAPVFVPLALLLGIIALIKRQWLWGSLGVITAIAGALTSPMIMSTLSTHSFFDSIDGLIQSISPQYQSTRHKQDSREPVQLVARFSSFTQSIKLCDSRLQDGSKWVIRVSDQEYIRKVRRSDGVVQLERGSTTRQPINSYVILVNSQFTGSTVSSAECYTARWNIPSKSMPYIKKGDIWLAKNISIPVTFFPKK